MESYRIGQEGEEIAARYLAQKGFELIERNFHSQQGEIDIVARDQETLVFVEVKNYSFRSFGAPQGAVRRSKRDSIVHAARYYLYRHRLTRTACRFDVVTVYRKPDGAQALEHYQNAFTIN